MYSEQEAVLMLGNFADKVPSRKTKNAINNFWKPWFYKYVHAILKQDKEQEEWIPLRHYYHRHTRALFWEMALIIPFGNSPWFRYLLGWMSPPEVSLLKLTDAEAVHKLYDAHHMDQDLLLPLSNLDKTLSYLKKWTFILYGFALCASSIRRYAAWLTHNLMNKCLLMWVFTANPM